MQNTLNQRYARKSTMEILTLCGQPQKMSADTVAGCPVTCLSYTDPLFLDEFIKYDGISEGESPYMDIFINEKDRCYSVKSNLVRNETVRDPARRMLAFLAVLCAIALISVVIASVVRISTRNKDSDREAEIKKLRNDIAGLSSRIDALRKEHDAVVSRMRSLGSKVEEAENTIKSDVKFRLEMASFLREMKDQLNDAFEDYDKKLSMVESRLDGPEKDDRDIELLPAFEMEEISDGIMNNPVREHFSRKLAQVLRDNDVMTIGDLVKLDRQKLSTFRNIGPKALELIESKLEEMGLSHAENAG